jgi:hypothetical protein
MANKEQHIVPHGKDWGVRGDGNKRLTVITPTKAEAEKIGRDIARNQRTELVIHDKHGIIRDKDSYGPGRRTNHESI